MRSVWKGTIVVGKVGIPGTLHKAAEHTDVKFTSLHRPCGTPVTQLRRCATCDVDLEGYGDTVRGFEFAEGQYVLVENDELAGALAGNHLVLDRFVGADEVTPVQLDVAYWIAPANSIYARRAYAALRAALEKTSLLGVGRLTMHTKERVVAVSGTIDGLVLHTLFTASEVRPPDWLDDVAAAGGTRREADLFARVLREHKPVRPILHRLDKIYPRRVLELLERKVSGGEAIRVPKPDAVAPIDLAATLRASIRKPSRRRART